MTRGSVAARVARNKERHPERYCPASRCLWRTGGGYCPRHQPADWEERVQALEEQGLTRSDAQAVVDTEDQKGANSHEEHRS